MLNKIIILLCFWIIAFVNKKMGFISVPEAELMTDFQFNLFTVSTVLAGFSFAVLGILTGLHSEELIQKISDTSIVSKKSETIKKSIFWFCFSCAISILYVVGIIDFIDGKVQKISISNYMFIYCVLSCAMGLIYFLISTYGVYNLIERVFGYNKKAAKKEKKEFFEEIQRIKEKNCIKKDTH